MKLTVVILTFNEEKELAECVKTLKFCDEVIVVDGGSSDRTTAIADQLGLKVYFHPFKDFADSRNFGLEKARGEWVLFIDSDERVPDGLQKEIIETLSHAPKQNGFYFRRDDFVFGKWLMHGETSKVTLVRLGRKGQGLWERPVHEKWVLKGELGEFKNHLKHYPHSSIEEFVRKVNFYSSFDAKLHYQNGVQVRSWHLLAYPLGKFVVNYILRRGMLDGWVGLVHAMLMSVNSFLIRAKLMILWRNSGRRY